MLFNGEALDSHVPQGFATRFDSLTDIRRSDYTTVVRDTMAYLRKQRARRNYVCAECSSLIPAGTLYIRDEPDPIARFRRGIPVRHLCTACAPANFPFIQTASPHRMEDPKQLVLRFDSVINSLPSLLLQTVILDIGHKTNEGHIVEGVTIPWFEIIAQIAGDPDFLFKIPWRRLEELIAGAYERDGWINVVLTPRSGDRGRDIIAEKPGSCAIRIVDQVKAYGLGHHVSADNVRAMIGVLASDANASKGFVTTTAEFAPGVYTEPDITQFMPYRLDLRDGPKLKGWLIDVWRNARRDV